MMTQSLPYEDSFDSEFAEPRKSLRDYIVIVQRRGRSIAIVGFSILVVSLVLALGLPATYRSSATILIQEQEIPQDLVRSTITSFADERIQVISQQVLARSVLLSLIEKYDLYARQRRFDTNEEILDRMRRDIKMTPISAEVMDHKTGNQVKATIAFKLSYDSHSADQAQKIANELATLYLNENTKNREERAAETSSFLEEETTRLSKHIAEVEAQLATFKEKNQGRLPELRQLNLEIDERTDNELRRVETEAAEARNHLNSLHAELSLTSPYSSLPTEGGKEVVLQPEENLKALKAQLAEISGAYTEDHPDIKRLKRQIAALEAQGYGADTDDDDDKRLNTLQARLVELRQKYSDDYPDVVRTRREITALQASTAKHHATPSNRRIRADNPVYLNLRSQIDAADAQVAALDDEKKTLLRRQADIESRLEKTPEVEREFLELSRDEDNSRTRFRELKEKQMEADVAQQLERDRKAERFTLIEPPQYPEKPASPNRPALALAGLLLSIIGGLSTGLTREVLDDTVKGPGELSGLLRVPTLAVIPLVEADADLERRKRRRILIAIGAFLGLCAAVALIHFFVMPIDVIWYSLQRRLAF
jgi:uncharacterized protein involved in exopolysaccharide biosynthesis